MKDFEFIFFILLLPFFYSYQSNNEKDGEVSEKYLSGDQDRPYVIGHRGMMLEAPENTLAAFSACVERGIGIEIDVRTSRDNELIIIHDDSFLRTTDGLDVSIRELTLSEIKMLDAGSWFGEEFLGQRIPTLEETFQLVKKKQKGKVPIAINIKDVSEIGEVELITLLKKYQLLEQAFCFDQSRASSERLKTINKGVRIGQNVTENKIQQKLDENFIDIFLISFNPKRDIVDQLHRAGKGIVLNLGGTRDNDNKPAYWKDFLTSGIDAILVDHALEFQNYIESLKWD